MKLYLKETKPNCRVVTKFNKRTRSSNNTTILISLYHGRSINISTPSTARQSLPVHRQKLVVFFSSMPTGNKSKLQILKPHQSITSMTFGFPSEVTRNPAAAGSTPESETLNLISNNSAHTKYELTKQLLIRNRENNRKLQ